MPPDALSLANLQARALFTHDKDDRLVTATPGPGGRASPMVLVIRTAAGAVVRTRADTPPALASEARAFAASLPPLGTEPDGAIEGLRALAERFAPVTRQWAGPAFAFPAEMPPPEGAIRITPAESGLLHPTFKWVAEEFPAGEPYTGTILEGKIVAVCHSPAITPQAMEAGVETAPEYRGRGAAGPAVLAWAAEVRQGGRVPIYSTWWENTASRAVARKLGLVMFGEDLHVT